MSCVGVTGEVSKSNLFEWKILDFFDLSAPKGYFHSSPSFVFDNTSFHVNIFPEGSSIAKSGYISLSLVNESNSPVQVASDLHIKKADGTLDLTYFDDSTWIDEHKVGYGYPEFYNKWDLFMNKSELVPSGILTIVCILKFVKDSKEIPDKTVNVENEEEMSKTLDYQRLTDLDTLSENLKVLSAYKESCEVTLQVEDKEFKAHRAILMARSPVFAAMFKHDTLEKRTGIINVQDCDCESFQEFLDFLYSGKLEDVSFQSAFHLYSTSHKYEVLKLQAFCTKYLIESLTRNNICDIVELADKYDETALITKTQEFFNENMCWIFPTAEWQRFSTNNPPLSNKLLIEYSKSKISQ